MGKLRQDSERRHRSRQALAQVYDPLGCSITDEFRRLRQVVHSGWVEAHQLGAGEIGGDGIISHHDPPKIARRAMQWPVAFHANDSIRDDKVSGDSSVDVEDTPIDAPPVEGILWPSVSDTRHDSE